MFSATSPTWRPFSSVAVRMPASTSVETAGLSISRMSGESPCCPASRALLVRSLVSKPVRSTVTPASAAQESMTLAQSELASYCGYGSQNV